MKEKLEKLKPYCAFIIVGFLALMLALLIVFLPKKEYPVKVGQVWECRMEVTCFENNIPKGDFMVTYRDSVYRIDEFETIYYIENGNDSLYDNLETFLYKSTRIK